MRRSARLPSILLVALALFLPFFIAAGPQASTVGLTILGPPHVGPEAPTVPHSAVSAGSSSYAIIFDQTGLASGTWWTLVLNGTSRTTQGGDSNIVFSEPNGTYAFEASAAGYTADPSSGTVAVDGQSINEMIVFTLPGSQFNVTFEETGLPPATPWSVSLNGSQQNSTATSIEFVAMPNGTYTFMTSTSSPSWQTTEENGTVTVSGSNADIPIPFEYAYRATFDAAGLPPGVEWYVNLTANFSAPSSGPPPPAAPHLVAYSFTSGTSMLLFSLPNGTYSYTVASDSLAWTPPPTSHSLTVAGASPPVQSIQPLELVPGPSGPSEALTSIVVGAAVVASIAVASVGYRTYALRPAPSSGPTAVDELYRSYDLATEVDPATVDGTPDALDDIF